MKSYLVRGCPPSIRNDAWWLSADGRGSAQTVPTPVEFGRSAGRGIILLALVICADVLLWQASAGLSLALMGLIICGAAQLMFAKKTATRTLVLAWLPLLLAALAVVEQVQFLSVVLFLIAGFHFAARLVAGNDLAALVPTAFRLPLWGMTRLFSDVSAAPSALAGGAPTRQRLNKALRDWLMPSALGLVFLGLFALANPLLDQWLARQTHWDISLELLDRMLFWLVIAAGTWPALRLTMMQVRPVTPRVAAMAEGRLFNAGSVFRALVLFNIMFAAQSLMDLTFLWGGMQLPDGMSYAQYAHRGAYPLLLVTLLAGGFAIVAQPYLGTNKALRPLLLIWVAQTFFLTISSILRLDVYVQAYGLTHLRFSAFVWMGLVAGGLALLVAQILMRVSVGWFLARAAGLTLVILWAVSFVNVAGLIARTNLSHGLVSSYSAQSSDWTIDHAYLCTLGDGAAPAIAQFNSKRPTRLHVCPGAGARIETPADWREWGYRNWRMRRSLAAIGEGAAL